MGQWRKEHKNWELDFDFETQNHYYKYYLWYLGESDFHRKNRMYIIPHIPETPKSRVLYFPDIPNREVLKKYIGRHISKPLPHEMASIVSNEMRHMYSKRKGKILELQKSWNKDIPKYAKIIKSEFPMQNLKMIKFKVKMIGTAASYHLPSSEHSPDKPYLVIHPRYDVDVTSIFKVLVTALTHVHHFGNNELQQKAPLQLWRDKQRKAEKIWKRYFPNDKSFIDSLDSSTVAKYAVETDEYLKDLGITTPSLLESHNIEAKLTQKEHKLFTILRNYKGKIVPFDELFDYVWKEDNLEYSLYAINKLAQRLRDSFLKSGIKPQLVHTQRGVGYMLYD